MLALAAAIAAPSAAQVSEDAPANGQVNKPAEGTAPNQATSSENRIGDIIVTARRVTERLQDIPASVAAVTGDQVARMDSLADIQSLVSGVTFKTFGPIPTVGIRGFGNRTVAGVGTNSTVGIFQDGVFVAPALVVDSSETDTSRIEIAKGPQSTLYGRSSFTGAINIVSNDPDRKLSGYIDGGYGGSSVGGENIWHIRGALSVPITDTLAIRVFGEREKRDGYAYDPVTGNRGLGYDRTIGRVKILWEPNDIVTARLTGTLIHDDLPMGALHAGRVTAPLGQNVLFGDFIGNAALTFGRTVWDAVYVHPQSSRTNGEQATLDLRFKTPIGELASLTDYQHSYQDIKTSLDETRLAFANGDTPFDENRYSQELRLSNKTGQFSYLAGVYLLHVVARQGGGAQVDLNHAFSTFGPGAALYDFAGFKAIFQPSYVRTNAYAAFGQVGYDFTDKLNLTLGIRQSRDELDGPTGTFLLTRTNFLVPASPYINRNAAFDATTGSANLSYKISPGVIAYGSYARGNSPGGLNVAAAAATNFAEQNVDAFELGLKSQLLDRHLQLNVALFDNEYSSLQITQSIFINGALNSLITNPANAHGRGVDLDALAVLTSYLRLGVQYTYVDSKITRYNIPAPPAPQVNFTGVPLVRSPESSLNASLTFSHAIGPGKFNLTAEEAYTSSYTNDYQGAAAGTAYPGIPGVLPPGVTTGQVLALYRTPGYALTNLNASYAWRNWELSAYVRNLLNHQYIAAVVAFDAVTAPQETPGEPRTFEVSLRFKF